MSGPKILSGDGLGNMSEEVTIIYTDVGSGLVTAESFEVVLDLFEEGEIAQIELLDGAVVWVNFMNVAYIAKDLV